MYVVCVLVWDEEEERGGIREVFGSALTTSRYLNAMLCVDKWAWIIDQLALSSNSVTRNNVEHTLAPTAVFEATSSDG